MNEDLKWLATNVHEWQDGCSAIQKDDYGTDVFLHGSYLDQYVGVGEICFTRDQWQAARDELSGKPSWDDAPEWATHLCQNATGAWYFIDCEPNGFVGNHWHHIGRWSYSPSEGKILGDWRNTLERRPDTCKRAVEKLRNIGFDADKAIESTSVTGRWRGPEDGLPPVGYEVELRGREPSGEGVSGFSPCHSDAGEVVKIYSHFTDDNGTHLAAYVGVNKRIGGIGIDRAFKPIPTEEDKAVEEMLALDCEPHEGMLSREDFCRALYRANFRKQESE